MLNKKNITIIGGGASALMLACSLDSNKFNISLYEKNATLGRKFLVAGKGGFNLTHSEEGIQFAERYHPKEFIQPFLNHFSNTDFRVWLKAIGIETYVGTSKRVFPVKGIKPIEVLKAIELQLKTNNVVIHYHHEWKGWSDNNDLLFSSHNQSIVIHTDMAVFALGGSSWQVTGSNGIWKNYFKGKKIEIKTFHPSNCAYEINWNEEFINKHQGQPLKNCKFTCGDITRKGEVTITKFGVEGSGIYPLSSEIRQQLVYGATSEAKLLIDFKPDLSFQQIQTRIKDKGKLSIKDVLEKKINLTPIQIELLKLSSSKDEYNDADFLSKLIKSYSVSLVGSAPMDEAISTVGGIPLIELNENLELKKLPHHYCIGEMVDWDAPTGGYLLQACFSMGKYLANRLNFSVLDEGPRNEQC